MKKTFILGGISLLIIGLSDAGFSKTKKPAEPLFRKGDVGWFKAPVQDYLIDYYLPACAEDLLEADKDYDPYEESPLSTRGIKTTMDDSKGYQASTYTSQTRDGRVLFVHVLSKEVSTEKRGVKMTPYAVTCALNTPHSIPEDLVKKFQEEWKQNKQLPPSSRKTSKELLEKNREAIRPVFEKEGKCPANAKAHIHYDMLNESFGPIDLACSTVALPAKQACRRGALFRGVCATFRCPKNQVNLHDLSPDMAQCFAGCPSGSEIDVAETLSWWAKEAPLQNEVLCYGKIEK